jgi:RNA polymerase sigma-70 factor (ECF subfamily)
MLSQFEQNLSTRQGDQEALVEIYERYQPTVFTYVFYRVCDQEIAEDLTADVFTRMLLGWA